MAGPMTDQQRDWAERMAPIAIRVATDYGRNWGLTTQERISAAFWELCRAAQRFDAGRGIKPSTYVVSCVRYGIQSEARTRHLIHSPDEYDGEPPEGLPADVRGRWDAALRARRCGRAGVPEDIADRAREPDEPDEPDDRREWLTQAVEALPPRLRAVIEGRRQGLSLRQISERIGMSKERARQLQVSAIAQLRKMARQRRGSG